MRVAVPTGDIGMEEAAPQVSRILSQAGQRINGLIDAEAVNRLLGGLSRSSQGGNSPSETADLMAAVGKAFSATGEMQATTMKTWMDMMTSKGSSGNDQQMLAAVLMMMMQMMMQNQKEASEQSARNSERLAEVQRESFERQLKLIEEKPSSPADAMIYNIGQQQLADALNGRAKDPLDAIADVAEKMTKVRRLAPGIFGGGNDEFSEGALKKMELQHRIASEMRKFDIEQAKIDQAKEVWQRLPETARSVGESIIGVISGAGFVPQNVVTRDDEEAARRAYEAAQQVQQQAMV